MENKQTAVEILRKHEDANEMHFHDVDRKWIIEAMEEYVKEKSEIPIISDEQIEDVAWEKFITDSGKFGFISGAKWYREQLKQRQ